MPTSGTKWGEKSKTRTAEGTGVVNFALLYMHSKAVDKFLYLGVLILMIRQEQ